MKKVYFLIILISLIAGRLHAQQILDSLKNEISLAKSDSIKAKATLNYATELFFTKIDGFDDVISLANEANALSIESKYSTGQIQAENLKALIYQQSNELDKAKTSFEKAIALCRKYDKKLQAYQMQDNMADVLLYQGKKDEALKLKLEARDYFSEIKDTNSILIAQFGIGYIHQESNELERAKQMYLNSINYNYFAPTIIETHGNLGIVYNRLNQLDSAEFHLLKAGEMGKDYAMFYLDNQIALAEVMQKRGKKDEALQIMLSVHNDFDKNSSEKSYYYLKVLIAEAYEEKGNLAQAKIYLSQANQLIEKGTIHQKERIGNIGRRIYRNGNNYKKALFYSDIYHSAKDSINSARVDSNYNTIQGKYDVAKKQETIDKQKIRIRNYGIGLLLLLGIGSIALLSFYNFRKQSQLKDKISLQEAQAKTAEIEKLKKENKIISMASMLEGQEEERKRIAQDLHDNIGTLMTTIKMKFLSIQKEIESIQQMNIAEELDGMINNASQEVRRISHRMTPKILEHAGLFGSVQELETQLIENGIEVKSSIEDLKEISEEKVSLNIYRIIQEIYNNIQKHSEATKVSVVCSIDDNIITLRIRDNGKGISIEEWENKSTLGLNGIKDRVAYLNGEIKRIEDSGTHFKISIPIS